MQGAAPRVREHRYVQRMNRGVVPASAVALALALGCAPSGDEPEARSEPRSPAEEVVARLRLAGSPLPEPLAKPELALRDTEGRPFDFRAETDGFLTLLFFGYTSCPDICPVHLANLAAVLAKDGELRRKVKVVFVGVDAGRDTPERVREFLGRFDSGFVGLTGTAEELERAQASAGVPVAFVDRSWEGGYSVSHAGWIVLFTPDNQARLRYPFGVRQREWAHDLAVLVREGWPPS